MARRGSKNRQQPRPKRLSPRELLKILGGALEEFGNQLDDVRQPSDPSVGAHEEPESRGDEQASEGQPSASIRPEPPR